MSHLQDKYSLTLYGSTHGHRASWADTMAHCLAKVQAVWIEELKKRCINIDEEVLA